MDARVGIGIEVLAAVIAKLRSGEDHIGVARIHFDLHAVTTSNGSPRVMSTLVPSGGVAVGGGAAPSAVVLKTAIDAVRLSVVDFDGVKLADFRAVALDPVFAAVPADVDAAVVSVDEVVGVSGVNPEVVVVNVDVGRANGRPRFASIFGLDERYSGDVQPVRIRRVDFDQTEIIPIGVANVFQRLRMRSNPLRSVSGQAVDFCAGDVGFEQGAVAVGEVIVKVPRYECPRSYIFQCRSRSGFAREIIFFQVRLQQGRVEGGKFSGRHDLKIVRRIGRLAIFFSRKGGLVVNQGKQLLAFGVPGQADAAGVFGFRESIHGRQFRPSCPCICAFPDAAAGSVAAEVPRPACAVPQGREEAIGIGLVDDEVHRPGVAVVAGLLQHAFPSGTAVACFPDTSAGVGRVERSQDGRIRDVRIARVQHDASNVVGVRQSGVLPRLAAVVARVHAGAGVRTTRAVHFAGSGPDAAGFRVHSDRPQGDGQGVIEQGFEGGAVVDRAPKSARCVGNVEGASVRAVNGDVHDASAHDRWPHATEVETGGPRSGIAVGVLVDHG